MSARPAWARVAVALALMAASCGGPAKAPRRPVQAIVAPVATTDAPAPPAPPVDHLPAQVEAIVRGYEVMAAAAGPEAPCPAIAQAITAAVSASVAERQAVRTAAEGDRAADVDALMVAAAARLSPAVATLDAAVRRCAGEPAVGRAVDALDR